MDGIKGKTSSLLFSSLFSSYLEDPDGGEHALGRGDFQGGVSFLVHEGGVGSCLG